MSPASWVILLETALYIDLSIHTSHTFHYRILNTRLLSWMEKDINGVVVDRVEDCVTQVSDPNFLDLRNYLVQNWTITSLMNDSPLSNVVNPQVTRVHHPHGFQALACTWTDGFWMVSGPEST